MSDLDVDFDEVRRSLQPVAATSHELRDGSEAHWDGSLRTGDVNELEERINTSMKYFKQKMDESRFQLAESVYNYAETVRRAVRLMEIEEQSQLTEVQRIQLGELKSILGMKDEDSQKSQPDTPSQQGNDDVEGNADSQIRHADPTSVEDHLSQLQKENGLPVNRLYQVSTGDSLSPTESAQSSEHINLAETVLPQRNMLQSGAMKPIIGGQQ